MKKLIYTIPLVLLLAIFAACGAPEETTATPEPVLPVSIWDGSVASSFAGGDGSVRRRIRGIMYISFFMRFLLFKRLSFADGLKGMKVIQNGGIPSGFCRIVVNDKMFRIFRGSERFVFQF